MTKTAVFLMFFGLGLAALLQAAEVKQLHALAGPLPTESVAIQVFTPAEAGQPLRPIGQGYLRVDRDEDGLVLSNSASTILGMGISYDRASGRMMMPMLGQSDAPTHIASQRIGTLEGMDGREWTVSTAGDPQSGRSGRIAALRLKGTPGRCVLTATFKKLAHGKSVINENLVMTYACPATLQTH
jgi:hypothetical protein